MQYARKLRIAIETTGTIVVCNAVVLGDFLDLLSPPREFFERRPAKGAQLVDRRPLWIGLHWPSLPSAESAPVDLRRKLICGCRATWTSHRSAEVNRHGPPWRVCSRPRLL